MVRKKHIYLTIGQLLALADASGWHRPIILTLGLCGLRWGELVGLQVGDVDFTRQRIHIVRTAAEIRSRIVVDIPKTGETRTIIFPALLRPCLEEACRGRQPSELLFPDARTGSSFGGHMEPARAIGSIVRSVPRSASRPRGR